MTTNADTGRTPAEEQLVKWDYYLGMAINLFQHHAARDLLLADGYDLGGHLSELKNALGWPSPSNEARSLANLALRDTT